MKTRNLFIARLSSEVSLVGRYLEGTLWDFRLIHAYEKKHAKDISPDLQGDLPAYYIWELDGFKCHLRIDLNLNRYFWVESPKGIKLFSGQVT